MTSVILRPCASMRPAALAQRERQGAREKRHAAQRRMREEDAVERSVQGVQRVDAASVRERDTHWATGAHTAIQPYQEKTTC